MRPIPVFPAVPSTINPPGSNKLFFSASLIIHNAALSFTDCPGFKNSALPNILHPVSSETCLNFIRGVFPIADIILLFNFQMHFESYMVISKHLALISFRMIVLVFQFPIQFQINFNQFGWFNFWINFNQLGSISGFEAILNGDCDELPESAFMYVGTIDEAFEKAKK